MPELPEVETVCWRLREGGHGEKRLVGNVIVGATAVDPKVLRSGSFADLVGAVVVDVERRAKWIVIRTNRSAVLLVHLKMTGDLHVVATVPPKFVRFVFDLDNGKQLVFTDPRRFGHCDVVTDLRPFFRDLGPEPLDSSFTAERLTQALRGSRPIKATLLDQTVIGGIGNIYADEALHRAGLDPRTRTQNLTEMETARLYRAIQDVLLESIQESRGELAWRYENRAAPSPFRVYERAGLLCLTCSTTLSSTSIAGRTTVWCPACQPSPLRAKAAKASSKKKKKKTKTLPKNRT